MCSELVFIEDLTPAGLQSFLRNARQGQSHSVTALARKLGLDVTALQAKEVDLDAFTRTTLGTLDRWSHSLMATLFYVVVVDDTTTHRGAMAGLAVALRQLRLDRGMTQGDLGVRMGVPQGTISRLELSHTLGRSVAVEINMAKAMDAELKFSVVSVDPSLDGVSTKAVNTTSG
ncbi:helix-turn-helix domain-containing protein [Ferrimicrobium acidiphilum]|uniref:helix-turn-helix domain-containing protein n=1 Tax=Ferrimicrobium acidiphilum TaxID=121039 RepID=UPI0023EF8153|nr:helix-turn-helix transcriptional regulator [Ferrimicrobium acidiphilum]